MGAGDQLKLTPYQSAAEAEQAVAKGETNFAVSHQSQILETYQQGGVDAVSYTHLNRGRIPRDAWTGSSQCCRRTTRPPTHPCQVRYQHLSLIHI